jgi:hypothetical protein
MDDIEKLEYLSLISKLCTELEHHLGLSDRVLAEYLVSLAEKTPTADAFTHHLVAQEGGDVFETVGPILFRVIETLHPKLRIHRRPIEKPPLQPPIKDTIELQEDLLPLPITHHRPSSPQHDRNIPTRNPERIAVSSSTFNERHLSKRKKLSSPERWELKQLLAFSTYPPSR